jgi:hypothetical protein
MLPGGVHPRVSGALRELGVTLCVGNELVYREAMHVYAAAGGIRARMGLHVPTADVMLSYFVCHAFLLRICSYHAIESATLCNLKHCYISCMLILIRLSM